MVFQSESELCQSYRNRCPEDLSAEHLVGKKLINEHAPAGLEGARCPQADLVNEDILSGGDITLAECKVEFEHRAVGQLLMYDWLLRYDAEANGNSIKSVDRRLILGNTPHSVVPTICQDMSIDPMLWASGGWQSIGQGAQSDDNDQKEKTEIEGWLSSVAASSLDSAAEDNALTQFVINKLPSIQKDRIYCEVPVGGKIFNKISTKFYVDAIGYSTEISAFYIIEVKQQPGISGLEKAIGQSVNYASMFRADWGLPIQDTIPIVGIKRAPWITNIYRQSKYDTEQKMYENAIANSDEPAIIMDKVEKYRTN